MFLIDIKEREREKKERNVFRYLSRILDRELFEFF